MNKSILFTTYLHRRMEAQGLSPDRLQREMGYRHNMRIRSWLEGWARPAVYQLSDLAKVLKADPVEVALGWVIDQCPELDEVLRKEVLDPRGAVFPRHSDSDIRASKPLPPVSLLW